MLLLDLQQLHRKVISGQNVLATNIKSIFSHCKCFQSIQAKGTKNMIAENAKQKWRIDAMQIEKWLLSSVLSSRNRM